MFWPNDADCILLVGAEFPSDKSAEAELLAGLPFLELNVVSQTEFDELVGFFAADEDFVPKGMVEVIQWS